MQMKKSGRIIHPRTVLTPLASPLVINITVDSILIETYGHRIRSVVHLDYSYMINLYSRLRICGCRYAISTDKGLMLGGLCSRDEFLSR